LAAAGKRGLGFGPQTRKIHVEIVIPDGASGAPRGEFASKCAAAQCWRATSGDSKLKPIKDTPGSSVKGSRRGLTLRAWVGGRITSPQLNQPNPASAAASRDQLAGSGTFPVSENAALNVGAGMPPAMSVPTRNQSGSRN
jgi:hypothetical protein